MDGAAATVTTAGRAGPFSYLNGPLPLDNYDSTVGEDYGYVATPAATPVAGQTYTSFVDVPVPGGTTTGSLAGVLSDGTRQQLVLTFLANANQTYFRALTHGIITWATNGVHLGYSRNYFSVVVDDMFSDDSQWSPAGHCTPGEDCPIGSTITTPNLRMVPADVTTAATWEAANNFRFTFAFNGEASDSLTGALPGQPANTAGLVDDPLTDALLANKSAFDWINHTYSHLHLGCVQNVTVRPWVCETTDGQPVNCPSVSSCNILWQTAAAIEPEITNNILFAQANGITVDPTELVSGEYSGLYYLPQEPIDNPNFITALNATGVKVTAADASRQFTTRPVGNAITSPRYPMSLWYNVDTVASEIDEYNYLYAKPADGGGGFCTTNPAIVTCLPAPLVYDPIHPNLDGFSSYIVPTETRMDLSHIMTNDPRPHYIHQPNFTGDRIVYPVMNSILGSYHSLYGASAPIVELTETAAANIQVQQQAWQNTAPTAVTAYLQNGNVTVQSNDTATHNVPVTVSPGTTVNGAAFGSAYEGDLSGWLGATPPTAQAILFTAPSTGTVGGTATLTATGGASGNPVVFTVDPSTTAGVCNVTGANGATLNYTAAGTCKVDANQAGNATLRRRATSAAVGHRHDGRKDEPDHHVRGPGKSHRSAVSGDGYRDRVVGAPGHVHDDDADGMYRGRHERNHHHAGKDRDVHGRGRAGRQRHLQRGAVGHPQLHGHQGEPDHRARAVAESHPGAIARDGQRDRVVGARGHRHIVDTRDLHYWWHQRGDARARPDRAVHHLAHPGRQRALRRDALTRPLLRDVVARPPDASPVGSHRARPATRRATNGCASEENVQ